MQAIKSIFMRTYALFIVDLFKGSNSIVYKIRKIFFTLWGPHFLTVAVLSRRLIGFLLTFKFTLQSDDL